MEHTFTYLASQGDEDKTIETFLKERGYSKKLISKLRRTPCGLTIAAQPVYTTHRLKEGEILHVRIVEDSPSEQIAATPMDIPILYEDADLLIINKPADMPVHPSLGNYTNTLANGLAYYFSQKGEDFTFRTINRLDRDTTGLLIVAKHLLSACILYRMAAERQLHRTYLAAVTGRLEGRGTIHAPIARKPDSILSRCVDFEKGEAAVTHYQALEYKNGYTLAQVVLETGRTHQIRVHMQYIGHPIPGDFLYNPDYAGIHRQALHSFGLEFSHPITGRPMTFLAPLPKDMVQLFYTSPVCST